MCRACFHEAGEPQVASVSVIAASEMAKDIGYYGAFHIVIEDMNLEDSHIESCMASSDATPLEIEFGRLMLTMTEPERMSALGLFEGFWSIKP